MVKSNTDQANQVSPMAIKEETESTPLTIELRRTLLSLARREAAIAADEASAVPYWAPVPASVSGHRTAAAVLASEADRLLGTS